MKDFIDLIPAEYFMIRQDFLQKRLDTMQVVKEGYHNGRPVLRVYGQDKQRCREISSSSKSWKEAKRICDTRYNLEEMLHQTNACLRIHSKKRHKPKLSVVNLDNTFNNSFFDSLIDSSCTSENNSKYRYKGRHYRSRSEMMFATALDELGLEFKYDVKVNFKGKTVTIDFVIVFREFNRCVFVEYYGRSEDQEYMHHNAVKIEHATAAGALLGRDMFIMSGTSDYTPGTEIIRMQMIAIVAQIAGYHVKADG